MSSWSVYVLRCADGSLYTGITTDVARRIAEHEAGQKGAKYLRGRGPLELVYQQEVGGRGVATRIEQRIRTLPKRLKAEPHSLRSRIEALLDQMA